MSQQNKYNSESFAQKIKEYDANRTNTTAKALLKRLKNIISTEQILQRGLCAKNEIELCQQNKHIGKNLAQNMKEYLFNRTNTTVGALN